MDEDKVTPGELMDMAADLQMARNDLAEERSEHEITRNELRAALRIIAALEREFGAEDVLAVIIRIRAGAE